MQDPMQRAGLRWKRLAERFDLFLTPNPHR
jgi:hypothetical protein